MKYVSCEAPEGATTLQRSRRWLYLAEHPVKVGDTVHAEFGWGHAYMRVCAVGTTRAAVGSTYDGAVRRCRPVSPAEANAVARIERAEIALRKARLALHRALGAAERAAQKAMSA